MSSLEALVQRNAQACLEARSPKCVCRCGGKLHGKAHSARWVRDQVRAIREQHELELEEEGEE